MSDLHSFYHIQLNPILLLSDNYFDNESNNIDSLCAQACSTYDLSHQLDLYGRAAWLCEKFHSYFHFEQSFFCLKLADIYYQNGDINAAIKYYRDSIFQDHLNKKAHLGVISCYQLIGDEEKSQLSQDYCRRLNLDITDKPYLPVYKRPYEGFSEYVQFATLSKERMLYRPCGEGNDHYWLHNGEGCDVSELTSIIMLVKSAHENYHLTSSKIYRNRSNVYLAIGKHELANNDLVKAANLHEMV